MDVCICSGYGRPVAHPRVVPLGVRINPVIQFLKDCLIHGSTLAHAGGGVFPVSFAQDRVLNPSREAGLGAREIGLPTRLEEAQRADQDVGCHAPTPY